MHTDAPIKEWSEEKIWNPFNSFKLLAQVYRWRLIRRGRPIPQPVLVTVDPINACNLTCVWCNSNPVIQSHHGALSEQSLQGIAEFLPRWKSHPDWEGGVESICIAGGGEPLLNPHVGDFIETCVDQGIQVGVVTNGTRIHEWIPALSRCTWVGVSVDAGSTRTFERIKGKDRFRRVTENIRALEGYSRTHGTRLARPGQGYGISYKFLLHPLNMEDIAPAAEQAKALGCRNFHLRPAGIPWFKLGEQRSFFQDMREITDLVNAQMAAARKLEDPHFGVFGVTHKFSPRLSPHNRFHQCHALFMTAVFMPPSRGCHQGMDIGLCCDRRGDSSLTLCRNITHAREPSRHWGGPKHWEMFDALELSQCPRCTYQPHNQIFERVILEDQMTYRFI